MTGTSVKTIDDAKLAAAEFLRRGCGNVVMTLGDQGALIALASGETQLVPAPKVKVIDTTVGVWPLSYKTFLCSTELSMKFIILINVKMPTIVGNLTFISRITTTAECFKLFFNILLSMSS